MKDLLDKISSYNILNFLLPGILFVVLAKEYTHFDFQQPDILTGAFVYYFFGIIISRFGSLVIEPILKKHLLSNLPTIKASSLPVKKMIKLNY